MLSDRQRHDFERHGLVRLPAAIPATDVAAMCERFWAFLATTHGIEPDRPDTWTVERPRHLQPLKRSGAFDRMATATVRGALDELLGAQRWTPPKTWGLPLVTFPVMGRRWAVPTDGWHVDSYGPDHEGVTVFAFLTAVEPGGGGTVVVSGSHRLFGDEVKATGISKPAVVKRALGARHPWLHGLWSSEHGVEAGHERTVRYLDEGVQVGADHLRVRELTGQPGDVILMDSRMLHTPAPNARTTPRMMLVEIVHTRRPSKPSPVGR